MMTGGKEGEEKKTRGRRAGGIPDDQELDNRWPKILRAM